MTLDATKRLVAPSLSALLGGVLLTCTAAATDQTSDVRCILASGGAASRCVVRFTRAVARCRASTDAACEAALRTQGEIDRFVAATEAPVRRTCTTTSADKLTSLLGLEDLALRTAQACRKWSDDFLGISYANEFATLPPSERRCQALVAQRLERVRDEVVRTYGRCSVVEVSGRTCDRNKRDHRVLAVRAVARHKIAAGCGTTFDALGLVPLTVGAVLDERVDALVQRVVDHARHFAQRVYPEYTLGPTAFLGPYPVGVQTLELSDLSRPNPLGPGPRPLVTEVYYPSTLQATVGVPRDIVELLGISLFPTPTHRNVAHAPGSFPLIVYSHGGGAIRFDNVFKMAHLASHGFVVISAEHPGSDIVNPIGDFNAFENRPLDVRFLIDTFLALNAEAGNFFEGVIDPARIGATGWSLGGFGVTALATESFLRGTFTDPRLKALLPLDGALGTLHWGTDAPGIFSTITIPTLSLGGDTFFSAALVPDHQAMFAALVPGPIILAYGVLHEAGHYTFSDYCEVPDEIVKAFNGGSLLDECEAKALPWRLARHIINYLALNFFDGVLNDNLDALRRLDPAHLAMIENLSWQAR